MSEFTKYRRTQIAEMRPFLAGERLRFDISVSAEDIKNGSPKLGDMIARNPKNHADQWLVAAQYFADNFEQIFVPVVAAEDETDAFNGVQAAEAASKILDYADYNLTMFDACCDEIPQGAKDIYDAAKRLRDLLPCT